MKIVFFGTDLFAAEILHHLLEQKISVVGVVTRPDTEKGRSLHLLPPPVKESLLKTNPTIPLFQPIRASNESFIEQIKGLHPDLFVVISYGQIIKQSLLDLPKIGAINIHPSILPRYRGPSPIQSAVLAGEKETGVSIMKMVLEMDAGDVIAVRKIPLPFDMTYGDLGLELCRIAKPLIIDVLKEIEKTKVVVGVPQEHERATFTKKISSEDAVISWDKPAIDIYNLVRGMNPRPGARTYLEIAGEKRLVKIYKISIVDESHKIPGKIIHFDHQKGFTISCRDQLIKILSLQIEGKKLMSATDFINGFSLPGLVL